MCMIKTIARVIRNTFFLCNPPFTNSVPLANSTGSKLFSPVIYCVFNSPITFQIGNNRRPFNLNKVFLKNPILSGLVI